MGHVPGKGLRAGRKRAEADRPARLRPRRLARSLTAVCAALGALLVAGGWPVGPTRPAEAQQSRTALVVPATVSAQPASRTRLPIEIRPADAVAKNSFIRIRGLPFAAALSEGHAIAPGAWAVPLNALANLTIILPVGIQGSSDVSIHLVSVDGTILADAKTTLAIDAAATTGAVERPASREPVVAPALPIEERERALGLHAKGQELLERGSVYAARKFFERAAEIGLAQSAVALAATYDPDELGKMQVVGLQPDAAAARKWYEKARELGAPEATERLRRLGAVR